LAEETAAIGDVGSLFDISNFKYLGLAGSNQIYVRRESKRLWETLEALTASDLLYVDGPPGVGKSTELYGWCMHKSQTITAIEDDSSPF